MVTNIGCAGFGSSVLAIQFRTTVESREDEVAAIITSLADYARDRAAEDDVKMDRKTIKETYAIHIPRLVLHARSFPCVAPS